jgi:DNA ligase-associated metallophosphoesterase
MDVTLDLVGENVTLLPERALYRADRRTLIVADPHWGKGAAFRAGAVPIPGADLDADLERLSRAIDRTSATRLVVLGDLLHAREGRQRSVLDQIEDWLARHPGLERLLVRGNHDEKAGDPPTAWGFEVVDEPFVDGAFVYRHFPEPSDAGYVLAGHLHPGARLFGRGDQSLRLPCFHAGQRVMVLPAFGSFTGLATVKPKPGDGLHVIADGEVIPILHRENREAGTVRQPLG